ncbi:LysR family transcriptional regulator [Vibrio penaeicida]|uniref:LysR family transcriptional regulator n=1 Tax=Vibrio penaeicida TaxID=104609 RepID=A0AAV5NS47_9VIBR|nr:LysR family transcriptional regulator [Vibrio penaeicida]RTZ23947.1 LysR family transcriptional regulator [Vibrio penaeicida]RTZ24779.1 LysR family transcriptional regulator [Vibrio penaeicida]GLQ72842.1 LysR family transcriptional regulator [Vibrio penaeicida]
MKRKSLTGQLSDIDLRLLRIFRCVVESGGFSAAEVALNISRAAISAAMADLEIRLGFKLCHRGRSGFSMTDEGQQVYQYTLQLLASLEEFKTQINTLHSSLVGELNIGITDNMVSMTEMRITNALAELKKAGPDVTINIRMIPPNDVEKGVLDGTLHVGMIPHIRTLSGLQYEPLYNETSLLYCGSGHPLFSETVQSVDLTEWDAIVPAYAQTPKIQSLYNTMKSSATATDREGIAFLLLTGQYLGYLPNHFAQRWVDDGVMKAILPQQYGYSQPFASITRKERRANLVLETFLSALN